MFPYDPSSGDQFWSAVRQIPGFPLSDNIPLREMLFNQDAIYELPRVLGDVGADKNKPVLVVIDPTEMQRGDQSLKPLVMNLLKKAGWQAEPVLMSADRTGQVHADMSNVQKVRDHIQPGASVVALGSGSVTDTSKYACFLHEKETKEKIPFLVCATANSVTAYTSIFAPIFINGLKRGLPSRYPDAVLFDLQVLRDAPYDLTVAGVGDLIAVAVSFPDWHLAGRLGLDPSACDLPTRLLGPIDQIFLDRADDIRRRSLEGMELLAKLLALGGLSMSFIHATAPLSGFEHNISHLIDLTNEIEHRPLALHGTQVGLTTAIVEEIYQNFFRAFDPGKVDIEACYPPADIMKEKVEKVFAEIDPSGRAGNEYWGDYRRKLEGWYANRDKFESFLKNWSIERSELERRMVSPQNLRKILDCFGFPHSFSQLVPPASRDQVKYAFLNASFMRYRLGIGDLLIFLGWDLEDQFSQAWQSTQEG